MNLGGSLVLINEDKTCFYVCYVERKRSIRTCSSCASSPSPAAFPSASSLSFSCRDSAPHKQPPGSLLLSSCVLHAQDCSKLQEQETRQRLKSESGTEASRRTELGAPPAGGSSSAPLDPPRVLLRQRAWGRKPSTWSLILWRFKKASAVPQTAGAHERSTSKITRSKGRNGLKWHENVIPTSELIKSSTLSALIDPESVWPLVWWI